MATIADDVVRLVVTVREQRNELEVPAAFVSAEDTSRLVSHLREREIDVPEVPMLSTNADGAYLLHEQPKFG
jgi:hypothetical protein